MRYWVCSVQKFRQAKIVPRLKTKKLQMETLDKNWYVEIGETVYEATTETVDQWIWDGTVLSQHRVSRGGQRWLEAGKVPRFAGHFSSADEMNEILAAKGAGTRPAPPRAEERVTMASQSPPMPFGVQLMGGSAVALVVALLCGYLWAYQFSAPKDLAVINNSPEMQAFQRKYDAEKAELGEIKTAFTAKPKPTPAPPTTWRGPEYDEHLIDCDRISTGKYDGRMPYGCSEEGKRETAEHLKTYNKIDAPAPAKSPGMVPIVLKDLENKQAALDAQFDVDQKKVIADARGADSRSKFYQTFVLLFLGLAGLNLARLSFSPKK
jgi:hypothetical protein